MGEIILEANTPITTKDSSEDDHLVQTSQPIRKLINYSTPYILNGEFFEIIAQDGESVTVKCCHCESRNIYKGSVKSTGNFHMHIKRKHPGLLPRVHELKLSSFLNRKTAPKRRSLHGLDCSRDKKNKVNRTNSQSSTVLTEIHSDEKSENPVMNKSESIQIKLENSSINGDDDSVDSNSLCHEIPCIQQIHEDQPMNVTLPQPERNTTVESILLRLEENLRGIEKEMRIRNQIETNRLCLELAEFKFLHPNFTFSM